MITKILGLLSIVVLSGCHYDADHPDQIGSSTGVHQTVDRSGLAAPRTAEAEGGAGGAAEEEVAFEEEEAAETKQALTNCGKPHRYIRTLTNPVITSVVPNDPAVCPAAWYHSTDPFTWRMGFDPTASLAPQVPAGLCQWEGAPYWPFPLGPSIYDTCRIQQTFICPNGIRYTATMQAQGGADGGWGNSKVTVVGRSIDGSCTRTVTGTFNITGY